MFFPPKRKAFEHFSKDRLTTIHGKIPNVTSDQRNTNQSQFSLIFTRMDITKSQAITSVDKEVEKLEHIYTGGVNIKCNYFRK